MNLSIRAKVFIMVIVGVSALTGLIYAISSTILLGSYVDIERDEAVKNVQRAHDAINDLERTLNLAASDWSAWDDPYSYVQGTNPTFEETDLTNLAMSNLEVTTLMLTNNDRTIIFARTIDLAKGERTSSDFLTSFIRGHETLLQTALSGKVVSGLVLTSDGSHIIAAHPIIHSDGSGPPAGVLVFGKHIDDSIISSLAELTHLSISLYPYDATLLPPDVVQAKPLLSTQRPHVTQALSNDVMAAYAIVYDFNDAPALILRIETSRPIYQQGREALRVFVGMAAGISICFGLFFAFFLESLVISRLARLEREVARIRDSHDTSAKVHEGAPDELGQLAREINSMLSALASSDKEERLAHEKIRAADVELKKHIDEIERMNAHMVDRELRMVELKKENAELRDMLSKKVDSPRLE